MDDVKAKQQIVEKITASTNILVTVSNDPSVDALSASLGLTLLLDKLDKHVTAVFSGSIPPAIAFLEPEKTFDSTTDSLRDFIIAIDKEKADHLRYKVEGDDVRIFITPYKTTITSADLNFSQGDYNVELVIALGVDNQDHLDHALESHGQILHDATIITVTAGDLKSTLGGIDWHDDASGSLSEMVTGLGQLLSPSDGESLIDASVATSLLTGIVAETDRFSNTKTTARVMTSAAQLMAAGADQQLIASKLEESHEIGSSVKASTPATKPSSPNKDSLSISHKPNETLEELDKRVKEAEHHEAIKAADEALTDQKTSVDPTPAAPQANSAYALDPQEAIPEPTLGGALSATTEQAAEDSRNDKDSDQNKTILSHAYLGASPSMGDGQTTAGTAETTLGHELTIDPLNAPAAPGSSSVNDIPAPGEGLHSAYASDPAEETPMESKAATIAPPVSTVEPTPPPTPPPAPAPADLGLPMPPAVPDFSQLPPSAPAAASAYAFTPEPTPQPERLGDILAPEPVAPTPPMQTPLSPTPPPLSPPASTPVNSNDPGQFKIPGQ